MSVGKPPANNHSTPSNAPKSSLISLAKAEDFNRWPGEWPEGVPKAYFPWVYPKYAEPESSPVSGHSGSDSATGQSWYSSPVQNVTTDDQKKPISFKFVAQSPHLSRSTKTAVPLLTYSPLKRRRSSIINTPVKRLRAPVTYTPSEEEPSVLQYKKEVMEKEAALHRISRLEEDLDKAKVEIARLRAFITEEGQRLIDGLQY